MPESVMGQYQGYKDKGTSLESQFLSSCLVKKTNSEVRNAIMGYAYNTVEAQKKKQLTLRKVREDFTEEMIFDVFH